MCVRACVCVCSSLPRQSLHGRKMYRRGERPHQQNLPFPKPHHRLETHSPPHSSKFRVTTTACLPQQQRNDTREAVELNPKLPCVPTSSATSTPTHIPNIHASVLCEHRQLPLSSQPTAILNSVGWHSCKARQMEAALIYLQAPQEHGAHCPPHQQRDPPDLTESAIFLLPNSCRQGFPTCKVQVQVQKVPPDQPRGYKRPQSSFESTFDFKSLESLRLVAFSLCICPSLSLYLVVARSDHLVVEILK